MILTFVRDLMFGSKIDALLEALGHQNKKVRTLEDVAAAVSSGQLQAAIINLGIPGDEPFVAAKVLRAHNIPVFCYYPHVETELYARAIELGVSEVHPRGAILSVLHEALSKRNDGSIIS